MQDTCKFHARKAESAITSGAEAFLNLFIPFTPKNAKILKEIIPKLIRYVRKLYICDMSTTSGMLKGSLQTIILKLLQENEKMYGYEITQKVKEITNGEILLTEGAMYPSLHKMEAEGILSTSTALVENRVRKYYQLTKQGQKEVKTKMLEAKSFIDNLQLLLNLKPKLS